MNKGLNLLFLLIATLLISLSVFAQEEMMEEMTGSGHGGAGLAPLHATSMILLAVVALLVVVISWKASAAMGGMVGNAIKLLTAGLAILVITSILEISFHFSYIGSYSSTTDHFLRTLSLLFFGAAFYKIIKVK